VVREAGFTWMKRLPGMRIGSTPHARRAATTRYHASIARRRRSPQPNRPKYHAATAIKGTIATAISSSGEGSLPVRLASGLSCMADQGIGARIVPAAVGRDAQRRAPWPLSGWRSPRDGWWPAGPTPCVPSVKHQLIGSNQAAGKPAPTGCRAACRPWCPLPVRKVSSAVECLISGSALPAVVRPIMRIIRVKDVYFAFM
jgi:hypothetical protein